MDVGTAGSQHEDLLTADEIQLILEEAKKPEYLDPNLIGLGEKKTSIFKLSPTTGLIMVRGNADTGLDHIVARHQWGRQVWKDDSETLDGASQFRLRLAPIEYLPLADRIYRPENLRTDKDNAESLFEVYQGNFNHADGAIIAYRLILYAGCGIIHTFYPIRDKHNRKVIFKNLKASRAYYKRNVRSAEVTYTIRYSDKAGNEPFRIIIQTRDSYPLERWYVQVNEASGRIPVTTFIKEVSHHPSSAFLDLHFLRAMNLDYGDMSQPEQEAKKLIEGKFDLENGNGEEVQTLESRKSPISPSFFAW